MIAIHIAAALIAFAAVSLWLALWGWAWDKLRGYARWHLWYRMTFEKEVAGVFTPEELAMLRRIDAMLDRRPLTEEDYKASNRLERAIKSMKPRKRHGSLEKRREYSKNYYLRYRDKILARQRSYEKKEG